MFFISMTPPTTSFSPCLPILETKPHLAVNSSLDSPPELKSGVVGSMTLFPRGLRSKSTLEPSWAGATNLCPKFLPWVLWKTSPQIFHHWSSDYKYSMPYIFCTAKSTLYWNPNPSITDTFGKQCFGPLFSLVAFVELSFCTQTVHLGPGCLAVISQLAVRGVSLYSCMNVHVRTNIQTVDGQAAIFSSSVYRPFLKTFKIELTSLIIWLRIVPDTVLETIQRSRRLKTSTPAWWSHGEQLLSEWSHSQTLSSLGKS